MRPSRQPLTADHYERPQQPWQCGLPEEGGACPMGPGAGGTCFGATGCHPVRVGDRWHCNRTAMRGGPCEAGPGHDGACAIVYQCTPTRSLRGRRGRFIIGMAAAAMGALCMMFSGPWRNAAVAPGSVSAHHASLAGGGAIGCAACHAAADATLSEWWDHSTRAGRLLPPQATLCMKCHDKTLEPTFATAAHGIDWAMLTRSSSAQPTVLHEDRHRDPREPIACSACHQEHQGLQHNLSAVGNQACQACHRTEFPSFAQGHPPFGNWPYLRRTRIAFDHAAHKLKHYPAERQKFVCAACHQADANGARQLTASYEASCAECHDSSIAAGLADGVPLVRLPMIDVDALLATGYDIGEWPAEAEGDFDGGLPPPAAVLMLSDSRGAAALAELGPNFDFYDIDLTERKQLAAAAAAATALKGMIDELSERGPDAIADRLEGVLGRKLTAAERDGAAGRLPLEAAAAYRQRWFGDDIASDQLAQVSDGRGRANRAGKEEWFQDAATLSLRYHSLGHADPWMRTWLDLLAEGASGPHGGLIEPLFRTAMQPTAPGQCGGCHSVDRDATGRWTIGWRSFNSEHHPRGFTKFNHAPHLLQMATGDCASCHALATAAEPMASYSDDDPHRFEPGFEPMDKASCAACHTPRRAGDSCVQCHWYHGR